MNLAALFHQPFMEYREALPDGRVRIRLRSAREDNLAVTLLHVAIYKPARWEQRFSRSPMVKVSSTVLHDYYQADFIPDDPRLCYLFEIRQGEALFYLDQEGIKTQEDFNTPPFGINPFAFAYAYPPKALPSWALGSVGYQIFPDRFRRAASPAEGCQPWHGGKVANDRFFGGDLVGIRQAIPYLKELGITLVYLTPIFKAATAHRYDTEDYYKLDSRLGSFQDLKNLTDSLHREGMRLILDGVFNHSGIRFAPFVDASSRPETSPYRDWFIFDDSKAGYQTFAYTRLMPKLNLKNPDAARFFLDVGRYWVREAGIDGWRLDVSPEVWPDFWRAFRRAIHQENHEALMIAECWDDSREWVGMGDMFDGTIHYMLSRAIWRFLAMDELDLAGFDSAVHHALNLYPSARMGAQWTYLSSHDTPRFLTRAGKKEDRLRLAAFFQLTAPGLPIIYYGDELGMEGGEDPDCRRPMAWDRVNNNAILAWYQQLTRLRLHLPALRTGSLMTHCLGPEGIYAYLRLDTQPLLCVMCTGQAIARQSLELPQAFKGASSLYDWLTGREVRIHQHQIELSVRPGACYILGRIP